MKKLLILLCLCACDNKPAVVDVVMANGTRSLAVDCSQCVPLQCAIAMGEACPLGYNILEEKDSVKYFWCHSR